MSKKNFKDTLNPATMFISTGVSEEVTKEPKVEKVTPEPTPPKEQDLRESVATPTPKKEAKSKRLNLLLQPSLMEDLGKIAMVKKDSVNNLINTVLTTYRDENTEAIDKYNKFFEV